MDELAVVLLGLIGAGLLIALINGGWTGPGGVTDWVSAKFRGKPRTA